LFRQKKSNTKKPEAEIKWMISLEQVLLFADGDENKTMKMKMKSFRGKSTDCKVARAPNNSIMKG
jgi:hypothetical protein